MTFTEGEYLDMCNQLKEKYDKIEQKEKQLEKKLFEIKRDLMKIYGLSEALDEYMLRDYELPPDTTAVLELLISTIKDCCEEQVLRHTTQGVIISLDVSHILSAGNGNDQNSSPTLVIDDVSANQPSLI